MTKNKIESSIGKIASQLSDESTGKMLKLEGEIITIRFISDSFGGLPSLERFNMLGQLFEAHAKALVETYTLIFEAFTPAEFRNLCIKQVLL